VLLTVSPYLILVYYTTGMANLKIISSYFLHTCYTYVQTYKSVWAVTVTHPSHPAVREQKIMTEPTERVYKICYKT